MAAKLIGTPSLDEISPNDLYKQVKHQEKQLSENAFKWLEKQFANQRFFSYPLFGPPHNLSEESRQLLKHAGVKCNYLLQVLRNCRTSKTRLHLIATWLWQEGICEPEDLLDKDFLPYQKKALHGSRGRLSITNLRYAIIVDNWQPYFERLLRAQRQGLDPRRLGFAEDAIQSAIGKHSAVAAACEYVAPRMRTCPASLANAYSRVFPKSRKRAAAQQLASHVS